MRARHTDRGHSTAESKEYGMRGPREANVCSSRHPAHASDSSGQVSPFQHAFVIILVLMNYQYYNI